MYDWVGTCQSDLVLVTMTWAMTVTEDGAAAWSVDQIEYIYIYNLDGVLIIISLQKWLHNNHLHEFLLPNPSLSLYKLHLFLRLSAYILLLFPRQKVFLINFVKFSLLQLMALPTKFTRMAVMLLFFTTLASFLLFCSVFSKGSSGLSLSLSLNIVVMVNMGFLL